MGPGNPALDKSCLSPLLDRDDEDLRVQETVYGAWTKTHLAFGKQEKDDMGKI